MARHAPNPTVAVTETPQRRIRSFVRREGRLTSGQQRALDELWPRFGIDDRARLDLDQLFGRQAPRTLEIGFGNGASLAQMAQAAPQRDFIGIEVHRPGVGHLLQEIEAHELNNVRILCRDAVEVLGQQTRRPCAGPSTAILPRPLAEEETPQTAYSEAILYRLTGT